MESEYSTGNKKTKQDGLLEFIDQTIPWNERPAAVESYYPRGNRGRPSKGIDEMMQCICSSAGSICQTKK